MKRFFLVVVALLVVLVVYGSVGKQAPALDESSASYKQLQLGKFSVSATAVELSDKTRSIDANGDYEGNATRDFKLTIWTPSVKPATPQPLLVYSHGFMSTGEGGAYLAEYLASYGYTVVAPTYPLTNFSAPGGPNNADVVNQPADVSFIIDTMLARNVDKDDSLYGFIDPTRIAAAGLSLGGMTTTMVSFHPLNADKRIAAAVSIAGPAYMFGPRYFQQASLPFMMVATPQDAMVSYQANAANIKEKYADTVLVTIDGASHAGFGGQAKWLRWMDNPDSLGCDTLEGNVDLTTENDWYHKLGSQEIGVLPASLPDFCTMNPMPKAINPLRQHQLNTLAVGSFLQCQLSDKLDVAAESCAYLKQTFAQENAEVSVVL